MRRWPIIVGFLAFLIFCVIAGDLYRRPVDKKLEKAAAEALQQAVETGVAPEGATVTYSGMRGSLSGLGAAAGSSDLVRRIDDEVGLGRLVAAPGESGSPVVQPAEVDATGSDSDLWEAADFALRPGKEAHTYVMRGAMPDDDIIDSVVDAVAFGTEGLRWVDAEQLRPGDEVDPQKWHADLPAFLEFLTAEANRVNIRIGSGSAEIKGDLRNANQLAAVIDEANAFAEGRELIADFRAPARLEIHREEAGQIKVIGTLRTAADLKVFTDELKKVSGGTEIESKVVWDVKRYNPDGFLELAKTLAGLVGEHNIGYVGVEPGVLVLQGTLESGEEKNALMHLAQKNLGDAYQIYDQIELLEPISLLVGKSGDMIGVGGFVPDEDTAKNLLATLEGAFPLAPAIDRSELRFGEGRKMPGWFPRALKALPELLENVDLIQIEVSGEGVVVQGLVRSEEAKAKALAQAEEITGGELPFENAGIEVLGAPSLEVLFDGRKVVVSGVLPTGEFRDGVEKSILGYLSEAEVENTIKIDPMVWYPAWIESAGQAIPEFLLMASDLGNARVVIEKNLLTVTAKLESDELTKPIQLLFSPMVRAGLKLELDLAVLPQPRIIVEHSEGMTRLSGRLRSVEARAKFANAVRAALPGAEIEDEVVVDPGVAESGWDVMMLDLVSIVLKRVDEPGIDIKPGRVRVAGLIDTEKKREAFEKALNAEFGEALEIESAIRIPERILAEPRVELEAREGKWALLGEVATEEEKAAIINALKGVRPRSVIINEIRVTSDVAPSPWLEELAPVVAALFKAEDPWLKIYGVTLIVEGKFSDASEKAVLGEIGSKIKGVDFDDSTELKLAPPELVIPPPPGGGGRTAEKL